MVDINVTPATGAITFDPAQTTIHVQLSGGNLTATSIAGVASGDASRATATHASGKYYCEFSVTLGAGPGANSLGAGIVDSVYVVGGGVFIGGAGRHGIAWYTDGLAFFNNADSGVINNPYGTAAVLGMAVDMDAHKIWFTDDGSNWNDPAGGQDPATSAGGIDISTMGANLYPAVDFENTTGGIIVANFGASAYTYAAPAGYGNW